ncbi:hypothetical protein [Leptothermofonsia sp. ETS-13]
MMQIHKTVIEGTPIPLIEVQKAGMIENLARLRPGFLVTEDQRKQTIRI